MLVVYGVRAFGPGAPLPQRARTKPFLSDFRKACRDVLAQLLGEVTRNLGDVFGEHGHLDRFHLLAILPIFTLDCEGDPTSPIAAVVNVGDELVAVVNVGVIHTLPEGSRTGPKCYLDSPCRVGFIKPP